MKTHEFPQGMHVETEPHDIWSGDGKLVARVFWGDSNPDDAMPTRTVSNLFSASSDMLEACKNALKVCSCYPAYRDQLVLAIAKAEGISPHKAHEIYGNLG